MICLSKKTVRYNFNVLPSSDFSDDFPWYLSLTPVTAEHRKRLTAYQSHGNFIPSRISRSCPHCLIPRLLESVAGRKYHYPPAFHRRSEKLFRIWKLHISRSLFWGRGVWLLRLTGFIPPAGFMYSRCCVFNFQDTWNSIFISFRLYRGRSREFDTPLFYTF